MTMTVESLYQKYQAWCSELDISDDYDWFVQSVDNNLEAGKTFSRVFTPDEFYFLVDNLL